MYSQTVQMVLKPWVGTWFLVGHKNDKLTADKKNVWKLKPKGTETEQQVHVHLWVVKSASAFMEGQAQGSARPLE